MPSVDWVKEYPGAVTVCDRQGIILYMNDKAIRVSLETDRALSGKTCWIATRNPLEPSSQRCWTHSNSTATPSKKAESRSSSTRHPGMRTAVIWAS